MENDNLTRQQKEILTIKGRSVTLQLSDSDCDDLLRLCGEINMSVAELLQNFIGDLVDGTYSNGSDERMYAREWFDRCGFSTFPQEINSLLSHLIEHDFNIEEFITTYDENECLRLNPEKFEEELAELEEGEKLWFQYELDNYLEDWDQDDKNIADEVEKVRKWFEQSEKFKS